MKAISTNTSLVICRLTSSEMPGYLRAGWARPRARSWPAPAASRAGWEAGAHCLGRYAVRSAALVGSTSLNLLGRLFLRPRAQAQPASRARAPQRAGVAPAIHVLVVGRLVALVVEHGARPAAQHPAARGVQAEDDCVRVLRGAGVGKRLRGRAGQPALAIGRSTALQRQHAQLRAAPGGGRDRHRQPGQQSTPQPALRPPAGQSQCQRSPAPARALPWAPRASCLPGGSLPRSSASPGWTSPAPGPARTPCSLRPRCRPLLALLLCPCLLRLRAGPSCPAGQPVTAGPQPPPVCPSL